MVRKGRLVTPPITADILESITRTTLMDSICPELLGMGVVEREIDRTELYVADEVFACGTSTYVTPVIEVDARIVNGRCVGRVTASIREKYLGVLRGEDDDYGHFITRLS